MKPPDVKRPPLATAPGREVPLLYRDIAVRARTSRAAAVKLFCLECVGYVRKDVTDCMAGHCPLYRHRPYQNGDDDPPTSENSGGSAARTNATGDGRGVA